MIKISFVMVSIALLLVIVPAFAHSSIDIPVSEHTNNKITVIIGHTNEPTAALEEGVHDGKHNLDLILRDTHTSLPINQINLRVDRYFWPTSIPRDQQTLDNAIVQRNLTLSSGGQPGYFTIRQILTEPGTYGYRVYGTITYYGGTVVNVDLTKMCSSEMGVTLSPHPLDNPAAGWRGGYGCTADIESRYWPPRISITETSFENTSTILQAIIIGAPLLTGIYGARLLLKRYHNN